VKAVVQRIRNAAVKAGNTVTGSVSFGLLVYLGVAGEDTEKDAALLAEKIVNLRIFDDNDGKMNLSLLETAGTGADTGVLAVSQFTLLADARKGRRPFYGAAAEPEKARALYECFMAKVREAGLVCEAGVFGAHMEVSYTNDGPVTILLDSKDL
jgi:D-tyrosyl-tRNA(Tyr) deacylase